MKLRKPKKKTKYLLKKAAASAAGVVTAASILVGGVFTSPSEIVNGLPETPPAIVQVYEPEEPPEPEETVRPTRKKSFKERLRHTLLAWSVWLRSVLLVPLWGLGTLLAVLLRKVLPTALRWILGALFPVLLLLLGLKLLFPDVPLGKLLCRKNRVTLIVLTVLLFLAGPVTEHFFPDKAWLDTVVRLALLTVTFLVACVQILMQRSKAAAKQKQLP